MTATAPDADLGGGRSHLWQPFTPAGTYAPRVIVEADGSTVVDSAGREYLDMAGGLWCVNVGYGRTEIVDAMAAQARRLPYYSLFGFTTEPAAQLADRLAGLLPEGLDKVFFTNSGSEAIDTALKIARAYWRRRGEPQKRILIGRHMAYHGVNYGGMSVGGIPRNRIPFGPLLPEVAHLPHNHCLRCPYGLTFPDCRLACAQALEELIQTAGPDQVAAVILEPVMGAGGVIVPAPGYLERVEDICREHGILFVLDEVITGFGRMGSWFGADRYRLKPDMITIAKGLSSAYAPIGAVAATTDVYEAFVDLGGELELPHGYTYSGHPVACAAALANLDIIEREDLPGRVERTETAFQETLATLSDIPAVAEVRGIGYLGGVELATGPQAAADAAKALYERGVIVRLLGSTLAFSPPLIVTQAEIERATTAVHDVLR